MKGIAIAVAVLLFAIGSDAIHSDYTCDIDLSCGNVQRWKDPLPIPSEAKPVSYTRSGLQRYEIDFVQFNHTIHSDVPAVPMWGYNGQYPGPTFQIWQDEYISVKYTSKLPTEHIIHTMEAMKMNENLPKVRNVVHLHGAHVSSESDGHPNDFIVPGESVTYRYTNDQNAAHLFYHDHALGLTAVNVYSGLTGNYFVRSNQETYLNLPVGEYEIPLQLEDRQFDKHEDGHVSLHHTDHYEIQGTDTVMVNGALYPTLSVEPRKYRFRLLSASDMRFYTLHLANADLPEANVGLQWNVIGREQGLLDAPFKTNEINMWSGERFDVIVDFKGQEGKEFILVNTWEAIPPVQGLGLLTDCRTRHLMKISVNKPLKSRSDPSNLWAAVDNSYIHKPKVEDAVRTRQIHMSLDPDVINMHDGVHWIWFWLRDGWNGPKRHFEDPVSIVAKLGDTEIWEFINDSPEGHPMHIHLSHSYIIDKQRIAVGGFDPILGLPVPLIGNDDALVYGDYIPLSADEKAPLDIVKIDAFTKVRVLVRFDKVGDYVYHCHMYSHEDREMMRPFRVVVANTGCVCSADDEESHA